MSGYYIKQFPYVDDYGIHVPDREYVPEGTESTYHCVMTKEMFIEAYNKWIKNIDDNSCVNCKEEEQHDYDECGACLTNNRSNWSPKE